MKALVGAFNQEKALVGAFSVIVQLHRWIDLRHYSGAWLGTGPGGGQRSYDPSNNVIHYHTDQLLPR